jgi:hypothetical protein
VPGRELVGEHLPVLRVDAVRRIKRGFQGGRLMSQVAVACMAG